VTELQHADQQALIQQAIDARRRAYAPYSRFAVGAALLDEDGQLHIGCNVENASYGLAMCAERAAVFHGVVAGATVFRALAVASAGALPPCGACRQVLAEFCRRLPIWLVDADDPTRLIETSLELLLPMRFERG
jgi:cytidine deaminase